MLAALITFLLLSGGGGTAGLLYDTSEVKKDVKAYVIADERKKAALSIVERWKSRIKEQNKLLKSWSSELDDTLAIYSENDAAVDAAWSAYFQQTEAFYAELSEMRFELKDQVTQEEWEQFSFE